MLSALHVDKNKDMIVATECGTGITGSSACFVALISNVVGGGGGGETCAFILLSTYIVSLDKVQKKTLGRLLGTTIEMSLTDPLHSTFGISIFFCMK